MEAARASPAAERDQTTQPLPASTTTPVITIVRSIFVMAVLLQIQGAGRRQSAVGSRQSVPGSRE
ncbi:hypothetical protein TBR22_A15430 [Luteitalea sp. TBR-22]|nr:hypothetical protein TBR22_A15430 [Luteitalea sp. TBR-22]